MSRPKSESTTTHTQKIRRGDMKRAGTPKTSCSRF